MTRTATSVDGFHPGFSKIPGLAAAGVLLSPSLAFACAHLSNFAAINDHAANQLYIKVAHPQGTHTALAHNGKGLWQQFL